MTRNQKEILESLHEKRLRYIEASKENNFEEGIRNLLSDLYPDKAHFIYELLQNAEDAEATEIVFKLTQEALTVQHNGKRIFDEKDVEGITGIGTNVKKKVDVNAIGKFGVGFKAVFAYTETPRIYSRDFSFEIRDLFCPYPIESTDISDSDTQFAFPLNIVNKQPEDCFREIAEGLNTLGDTAILFLNNINKIIWQIEGQGPGCITRNHKQGNIIEIKRQESNILNQICSFWLRFQKKSMQSTKLKVGIAFKLETIIDKKESDSESRNFLEQIKIVPVSGQLCIFFPAEKETTRLGFHINGPYASTIDRASIPHDHNGNQILLEETATLLEESLPVIRDLGFLTKDFLEVLPNNDDKLADFYQPFIDRIVFAMKELNLMPTASGMHVCANNLLKGTKDIRRLIDDDDLCFFTGRSGVYWAPGAIKNGRVDRFLQMLKIDLWDIKELMEVLNIKFGISEYTFYDQKEYTEQFHADDYSWISNKTDEWMQRLYAFLANVQQAQYPEARKGEWRILRTEDGKYLQGKDTFFPIEESTAGVGDVSFIKSEILSKGDKNLIEKVRTFLEQSSVREIDEEQKIKHLLEVRYCHPINQLKRKNHIAHVKRFIGFFKKNGDLSIFQGYSIFMDAINGAFREAHEFYIDKPFKDTGVACIFKCDKPPLEKKYQLSRVYLKIEGFSEFAMAVGVWSGLNIEKTTIDENPDYLILHAGNWKYTTWTGLNIDYMISNLEILCQMNDINISKLIWNTMSRVQYEQLWAQFRPNQQYETQKAPSQIVHILRNYNWIPNRNGEFCKPSEIIKDQLRDEFVYNDSNSWLSAIDFEKKVKEVEFENQEIREYAKALGIKNIRSIEIIKEIENDPNLLSQVQNFIVSRKTTFSSPTENDSKLKKTIIVDSGKHTKQLPKLPAGNLPNPERYIQKIKEEFDTADKKEFEEMTIRRRVSSNKIDAKTWLKEEYENEDKQMICQICKNEMPFRTRNGDYYFEDVEVFDDFEKEIEQLHIALCPVCAAKYKLFIKSKDKNEEGELERDEMNKFKSEILESNSQPIPIKLDKSEKIYFTMKHITAIKTLIQVQNDE